MSNEKAGIDGQNSSEHYITLYYSKHYITNITADGTVLLGCQVRSGCFVLRMGDVAVNLLMERPSKGEKLMNAEEKRPIREESP